MNRIIDGIDLDGLEHFSIHDINKDGAAELTLQTTSGALSFSKNGIKLPRGSNAHQQYSNFFTQSGYSVTGNFITQRIQYNPSNPRHWGRESGVRDGFLYDKVGVYKTIPNGKEALDDQGIVDASKMGMGTVGLNTPLPIPSFGNMFKNIPTLGTINTQISNNIPTGSIPLIVTKNLVMNTSLSNRSTPGSNIDVRNQADINDRVDNQINQSINIINNRASNITGGTGQKLNASNVLSIQIFYNSSSDRDTFGPGNRNLLRAAFPSASIELKVNSAAVQSKAAGTYHSNNLHYTTSVRIGD